jgi:hypothetical protein
MTPQEIFDYVATFLIKQGQPALTADGACAYRAPNGCRCAAGCLIPDCVYNVGMEGCCIDDVILNTSNNLPEYMVINRGLILGLQEAHDESSVAKDFIIELKSRLSDLACQYSLSAKVLSA